MPTRKRRGRGYIEELRSGSFRAVVPAGTDLLTGHRRVLRETCKTYAEAEKALTRLQLEVDRQQHPKSAITLAQAIEQWLEVAELEQTTRERYEDLIRLYVLPTFGELQAGRLDAELLERFYARLQRCRSMCGARPPKGHTCKPLSTSTTRKIHYIIRGALSVAVRWKYLNVNVADYFYYHDVDTVGSKFFNSDQYWMLLCFKSYGTKNDIVLRLHDLTFAI